MTSIDYLVEQLQKEYKWFPSTQSELILEVKEMELEQLQQAYERGFNDARPSSNEFGSIFKEY